MLKEKYPLVSVITVNFNSTQVTGELLQSIRNEGTYPEMEIIVVDNGSSTDPGPALLAINPKVKIVYTGKNLGFAGGNNAGIREAKGDYFFLVNNDTEFTPGLIEGLLEIFSRYPDAGIACPKFQYFFQKGIIEYAGYHPVNIFTGRNGMVGSKQEDEGQFNEITVTHYAHGGAMMVPRKIIEEVGGMYEPFFLYYEELDWSEQIKRKGYKIYYQPASLIYHKESMTTGKSSPLKTFYLTRNRILFMRRNVALPAFMVFSLYLFFFTIPKNSITYLINGQRDHLRSFWKGILWQFKPSISIS